MAAQVTLARQARDANVILWAASGHGAGTPEEPLSLLTLTLAVAELAGGGAPPADRAGGAGASEVSAVVVDDPGIVAFLQERRVPVPLEGANAEVELVQIQVFLVSEAADLTLVLTVATLDPSRHDEARAVAREVATSIKVLEVEAQPA